MDNSHRRALRYCWFLQQRELGRYALSEPSFLKLHIAVDHLQHAVRAYVAVKASLDYVLMLPISTNGDTFSAFRA